MKKCPYCNTFMNDDVTMCPNCLKDVSSIVTMPPVSPKENKGSFYSLIFGVLIAFGSVAASLSQRANRLNYVEIKNDLLAQYELSKTDELYNKILQVSANIKTCEFREVAFYIACALGIGLMVYSLVSFIIKKVKAKKVTKGGN